MRRIVIPLLAIALSLALATPVSASVRVGVSQMSGAITLSTVRGDKYPIQMRSSMTIANDTGSPVARVPLFVTATPLVGNAVAIGVAPLTDALGQARFDMNYERRGMHSGDAILVSVERVESCWWSADVTWDHTLDTQTRLFLTIP